jgi:16S rRNA processing protein RimM
VNTEQHEFGRVARILQTGANDVLVVEGGTKNERETLIPFIASAIKRVDLAAGVISVDWGRDY